MEIRRSRNKIMVIMIALFVLAVLISAATLGYFWYRKAHPAEDTSTGSSGGTISLDAAEKVETEKLTTALVIPKSTDKAGDTIKLSYLTISTPKAWRTVNGRTVLNTPLENIYAESNNDILAQLIMVPESNPTDSLLATNGLSFYNITSWLGQSSRTQQGTVTPETKAKYIQNIIAIGTGKAADKSVCDAGYGVLNTSICGDMLKATPVTTSDGLLTGVIFLNTTAQSVSYDPQAFVFLTGKVKDQQLFGYGAFHLLDKNSHTLSINDSDSVKAAWESLIKGNVPSDTLQLYQHVIDAVKSIYIQAN